MRVLQVFNRHRHGGGADNIWDQTISISRERGLEVGVFSRDSNALPNNLYGKFKAFSSGIYAREAVAEFDRVLQEFKPDVVHAHELYPLVSHWILPRCKKAGIPVVFSVYDFRLTCPIATHYSKGKVCHKCASNSEYWAVLKNCRNSYPESIAFAMRSTVTRKFKLVTDYVDQFIVLSEFSRDWLIREVGLDGTLIHTVSPAISAPETSVDPSKGEYIAYAGRFAEEKGVALLAEAARRLDLPLKLAGGSPNHPLIGPGSNIECKWLNPEDLAEFYRGARMLVVPSTWYETFGVVAGEAMSHGVPVIATRIGALQNTVDDEVTGLLFENGNVSDLAEKISRLWNDPELCKRLGHAGRKKATEQFSIDEHFRRTLHAYQCAL